MVVFLDEVGELPLEAQGKLLRVLEEGRYERLGSTQTFSADVRIIAATNRDLKSEVAAGRFRQDLYFRLNVYPIRLPPLRDRREDIPDLVWHFVHQLGARMGKTFEEVHGPSLAGLARYSWPGNVRELRNVVERAMIRCEGPVLRIPLPSSSEPTSDRPLTLDEAQRRHILDVLRRTDWKVRGPGGGGRDPRREGDHARVEIAEAGYPPSGQAFRHFVGPPVEFGQVAVKQAPQGRSVLVRYL